MGVYVSVYIPCIYIKNRVAVIVYVTATTAQAIRVLFARSQPLPISNPPSQMGTMAEIRILEVVMTGDYIISASESGYMN